MTQDKRARQIAFYDRYLSEARRMGVSFDQSELLHRVVAALKRGDVYLNTIPLQRWDSYHFWCVTNSRGVSWSLSDSVCTAKTAAIVSALRLIFGEAVDLESGAALLAALDQLSVAAE